MKLVHFFIVLVILFIFSLAIIFHLHKGPLTDLKAEVAELQERLAKGGEQREEVEKEIQKRSDELDIARREINVLQKKVKKLTAMVAQKEQGISAAQKASRSKDKDVQTLAAKLLLKEQELQSVELELSQMNEAMQRLNEDNKTGSQRIEELTQELGKSVQAHRLLTMKLENRDEEIKGLEDEIHKLRTMMESLEAEKKRAIQEQARALERLTELETALEQAKEEASNPDPSQVPAPSETD